MKIILFRQMLYWGRLVLQAHVNWREGLDNRMLSGKVIR